MSKDLTLAPKVWIQGGSATPEGHEIAMKNVLTMAEAEGYTKEQLHCTCDNWDNKYIIMIASTIYAPGESESPAGGK